VSSSPFASDPSSPIVTGSIFAGKYRVEQVLGQGGMGLVLAARHLGLDEPVAIKVLLPAMMQVSGMVERFTREARASAKIKNDYVVRVTDVDTLPSGVPYMVMERLEGSDLSELCKRVGPLPIADAVRYLLETCSAIGEAHAMGIIHRDLKPANLFLARRRDGATSIKVLDFGISKAMQSVGEHTMTVAGTVLGSPIYMSPEQISAVRDLDGRTDLWSLGVILYQLVTGLVPFPAESLTQLCALVLQTEPRRPSELRPDLPPGLEAVVLRCLEKDRVRRFSTASELSAALLPFAGPLSARSGSMPSFQATAPLASPPLAQSVSALAMSQSAPITSSKTLQRAGAKSSVGIIGFVSALGVLGLGGVLTVGLQHIYRPNAVSPSAGTTAIADAPSAAPLVPSATSAIDAALKPPMASSAAVEKVGSAPAGAPSTSASTPRLPPRLPAVVAPLPPTSLPEKQPPKAPIDPSEIQ
jgi:serine/threonine-protein kinase